MTYPKSNGKQWDSLRKREFDKWRLKFRDSLNTTVDSLGDPLPLKMVDTMAWNCAFEVVTAKTKE